MMRYLALLLALLLPSIAQAQFKAGEDVTEWPRVGVAFTEAQGYNAIAPLFPKLKVKEVETTKSKVKVPFDSKDYGYGRKMDETESANWVKAQAAIKTQYGWLGWVKNPSKENPGISATLESIKTGVGVLASSSSGTTVETSFADSRRLWLEWTQEIDGKKTKTEFLFFLRDSTADDWNINFDGFRTMADPIRGIGPQATFEFFKLFTPTSAMERLTLAYLCAKTLKATPYAWWEHDVYAEVLPKEEVGTLTPFFSHFLKGAEEGELKRATWLYCYLYGVKTPDNILEYVEGAGLLLPEAAKRAKAMQEDRKGMTFHQSKNLKGSKVRALLKEQKEKLEEK